MKRTLAKKAHQQLAEEYNKETDTKGTAWGAWNAVVAYNDHRIGGRNRSFTAAENRFQRIGFANKSIADKAMALLLPAQV